MILDSCFFLGWELGRDGVLGGVHWELGKDGILG